MKSHIVYGSASEAHNLQPSVVSTGAGDGSLVASTSLTYTPVGDVHTVDGPLPGAADTTTYRYDNVRRVVGVIGPDPDAGGPLIHRAQRVSYDPRGNAFLTEVGAVHGTSDAHWSGFISLQQQAIHHDHFNRPLVVGLRDGSANVHSVTHYSYDAAGRVECTALRMNPDAFATLPGSACELGAQGRFGPDRITKNEYDVAGHLLKTTSGLGSATEIVERASYNPSGQPISLIDGNGNESEIEYDGFGRLSRMLYPNPAGVGASQSDFEQYAYNAAGLVTQYRQRSGETVTYHYDALNRVTLADASAANDIGYTYDNLGRTLSAYGGGQTLSMSYDALGRQRTQTGPLGTVGSEYDIAGRRTQLTWPDGFFVNYDYNVAGDLTAIRENGAAWQLVAYNLDNLGRRGVVWRANGANTTLSYDGAGRLAQLNHDLPGTADDLALGFSYNPAGQIVNRTISNASYVHSPAAGTTNYTNNGRNQVTSVGGSPIGYDARQNITSAPMGSYGFDSLNRLTSSTVNSSTASYSYDPADRLYQEAGAVTYRFLYDGAQMIAEYDAGGTIQRRFVPGLDLDEHILAYEGTSAHDRRWMLQDERQSVLGYLNGSGAPLSINTYDEYGQPGANNAGRFQYTGQMRLHQADLYHYRARAYSPQLGRFMQTDPIGYGDGPNLYAYVGADPMNRYDPSGEAWERVETGWLLCDTISMPGSDFKPETVCRIEYKWEWTGVDTFQGLNTGIADAAFGGSSGGSTRSNLDRCAALETARSPGRTNFAFDWRASMPVIAGKYTQHSVPRAPNGRLQSYFHTSDVSLPEVYGMSLFALGNYNAVPSHGNVRITANIGKIIGYDYMSGSQTSYLTLILSPSRWDASTRTRTRTVVSAYPGCPA